MTRCFLSLRGHSGNQRLTATQHDHYKLLTEPRMANICIYSLTVSALLFIVLLHILPEADDIMRTLKGILNIISVLCAAWSGASERENEMIFLPCGWLVGYTMTAVLHRAGLADLQARFGVSDLVSKWCYRASIGMFFALQVWLFGFENSVVTIVGLWFGIGLVYKKLG
jgi:hypothetical protein